MPVKLSWDTSSTENESSSISDFSFSSDCFGHTLIKGDNYPVLKKLLEKGLLFKFWCAKLIIAFAEVKASAG